MTRADIWEGRSFVCLSPIPWCGLWTSRHELSAELARRGVPVIFVDPPANALQRQPAPTSPARPLPAGLTVVEPPPRLPYGALGRWPRLAHRAIHLNATRYAEFVASHTPRRDDAVVFNSFMPVAGSRVNEVARPAAYVYHRSDELRGFPGYRPAYLALERRVAMDADVVLCVSEAVRAGISDVRGDAVVLRNAVDSTRFAAPGRHALLAALPRPLAVLVGVIDDRFDPVLISAAASRATLAIAGPVRDPRMLPDGCIQLGSVPPEEIPSILAAADVAIAPYREFPGDPLKIYEYLAAGLPVVASRTSGLAGSPIASALTVASDPSQFAEAVERAASSRTIDDDEGRRALARSASWANRVDTLIGLVADALARTSRRPVTRT